MAKIIKIGVLYLSRLEIDNYNDNITISMDSDKTEAKTFYDDNFLAIAINIIHNTINAELELEIIEEKEGKND